MGISADSRHDSFKGWLSAQSLVIFKCVVVKWLPTYITMGNLLFRRAEDEGYKSQSKKVKKSTPS